MKNFEYKIEVKAEQLNEVVEYINTTEFDFCEMRAIYVSREKNQITIRELEGNAVDYIDGILDKFNGYYVV